MDDTDVSYEPLGAGDTDVAGRVRTLARLPRLAVEASRRITRTDSANHEVGAPRRVAIQPTPTQSTGGADPMATVRFDTFPTESGYVEPGPAAAATPAVAPTKDAATPQEDSLLLRLEAAVLPYERWVALAAVLAALGLTLTLLGGGRSAPVNDSPPQDGFVQTEAEVADDDTSPLPQPAIVFAEGEDESDLDVDSAVVPREEPSATGPLGMPRPQNPRANFAQASPPIDAAETAERQGEAETSLGPPAVDGAYPRTAAADEPWDSSDEGVRR